MQNTNTYIVSNWKMNGTALLMHEMVKAFTEKTMAKSSTCQLNTAIPRWVFCPPALLIKETKQNYPEIILGGQDCHPKRTGAFTGNISALLLKESGATYVIVGHSERRHYHNESNALIAEKACMAIECGLIPIICIGESEETYNNGLTLDFLKKQLDESLCGINKEQHFIVAYEPIWAIGTGKTATRADIEKVHSFLRTQLPDTPLLYGGSVTASNAYDILTTPNVNGVLVGGASLKVDEFKAILEAACMRNTAT